MCIYIQKYEMEGQISLFQLNSKGGPISLEENHLKCTQPLSNIHFIKIGKRGRGRGHEIQVELNNLVSEPVMEEQCISHIEAELGALNSKHDNAMKQMQEMFFVLNYRLDQLVPNQNSGHSEGSSNRSGLRRNYFSTEEGMSHTTSSTVTKLAKLDFPRFNGNEDPISRICQVEQFFEFQQTPKEEHVPLAVYHSEGEAQLWYRLLEEEQQAITWNCLEKGLNARYGPT